MKDRIYINFLNKDKKFKEDREYFNSMEDAIKWGSDNFDKFNIDMINYK
ncbi:MAG: hypothetical protein ABF250_08300 [Polaribacter sp.]